MKIFPMAAPEKFSLRQQAEKLLAAMPDLFSHSAAPAIDRRRGAHSLRTAGDGEDFWQFREYGAGDTLSMIDWRRSGRSDDLHIRHKERQSRQTFLLWTAAGPDMNFRSQAHLPSKQQNADVLVLAAALLLNGHGEKVGWLGDTAPARAEGIIDRIENIMLERFVVSETLPGLNATPRHSTLIMAGDFIQPVDQIRQALDPLAATCPGGFLIQILDPLELDLKSQGRVLFENPSGTQKYLANDVSSLRHDYQVRLRAHRKNLEDLCRAYGWTYLSHRTDGNQHQTLLELWRRLNNGIS